MGLQPMTLTFKAVLCFGMLLGICHRCCARPKALLYSYPSLRKGKMGASKASNSGKTRSKGKGSAKSSKSSKQGSKGKGNANPIQKKPLPAPTHSPSNLQNTLLPAGLPTSAPVRTPSTRAPTRITPTSVVSTDEPTLKTETSSPTAIAATDVEQMRRAIPVRQHLRYNAPQDWVFAILFSARWKDASLQTHSAMPAWM